MYDGGNQRCGRLFAQNLADIFQVLTDLKMLGALLFAKTALFAICEGLAFLLEVVAHHISCMILQAIDVVVGPNFEDAGNIDIGRAGLAIFAAGAIQLGELLELLHRLAERFPLLGGESGIVGGDLDVLLNHIQILHAGQCAVQVGIAQAELECQLIRCDRGLTGQLGVQIGG